MFQLILRSGSNRGRAWTITNEPMLVGRDKSCSIQLDSHAVSRRHCQVLHEDGRIRVADLGSRNGTLVNGHPVDEATVSVGDEIALGDISLMVTAQGYVPPGGLCLPPQGETTRIRWTDVLNPVDELRKLPSGAADLKRVYDLSRRCGMARSVGEVYQLALGELQERLNAAKAWLALFREEDSLEIVSWTGVRAEEHGRGFPHSIALHVRQTGNAETAPCAGGDCLCLVAPITTQDEAQGIVAAVVTAGGGAQTQETLTYLAAVGFTLAPYLQLQEDRRLLETEVARARLDPEEAVRIVGSSEELARILYLAKLVARSEQPILVTGETGTGKELIARLIHARSDRHAGPFIAVNCAAIPPDLFESEVFGHERGAFTGAVKAKPGLLEQSDGGTLFLDEIGDLSLMHQARILRAVESGVLRRVGATKDVTSDFRVVAATNKHLMEDVQAGRFRDDLYHRLRGFEVRLPALRDRRTDIPELAQHFLAEIRAESRVPAQRFDPKALEHLQAGHWPGNVRELRQSVRTAAILAQSGTIDVEVLAALETHTAPACASPKRLAEAEARHIEAALAACGGSITKTAQYLGIARSTLYEKLAAHGIER